MIKFRDVIGTRQARELVNVNTQFVCQIVESFFRLILIDAFMDGGDFGGHIWVFLLLLTRRGTGG